jgi:hypothetical protein
MRKLNAVRYERFALSFFRYFKVLLVIWVLLGLGWLLFVI